MADCFELSDARLMQKNGVISKVEIIPQDNSRYVIAFVGHNGQHFNLKTQRGSIRHFKTLDSAFSTIESLGFSVSKLVVVNKGE